MIRGPFKKRLHFFIIIIIIDQIEGQIVADVVFCK